MSAAVLEITDEGLTEALLKIEGLAEAPRHELTDGIGRLVQEQTRRRIEEEKTSPAGQPWKANRAGTSILYDSGALYRSIDYISDADSITIGSGLIYARIHQEGGVIKPRYGNALKFWWESAGFVQFAVVKQVTMPRRQYLGLSAENQDDVVEAAEDWLGRLLQ